MLPVRVLRMRSAEGTAQVRIVLLRSGFAEQACVGDCLVPVKAHAPASDTVGAYIAHALHRYLHGIRQSADCHFVCAHELDDVAPGEAGIRSRSPLRSRMDELNMGSTGIANRFCRRAFLCFAERARCWFVGLLVHALTLLPASAKGRSCTRIGLVPVDMALKKSEGHRAKRAECPRGLEKC